MSVNGLCYIMHLVCVLECQGSGCVARFLDLGVVLLEYGRNRSPKYSQIHPDLGITAMGESILEISLPFT